MITKKQYCFILIFSVILNSCQQKKSDCPQKNGYHLLSNNNRATPYNGYDTLVFISNTGDTAILYGQGKKSYEKLISTVGNPCDNITYHDENLELIFTGNNSVLSKIGLHGYYETETKGLYGELTDFTVNSYTSNGLVNNMTSLIMDTSCLYYSTDTICYSHRRITVNGNIYYCTLNASPPYVYYSPSFGIVRVDSIAGKNWYLKR